MEKLKKKKLSNKWLLAFLALFMFIGCVMFSFITIGYSTISDEVKIYCQNRNTSITESNTEDWTVTTSSDSSSLQINGSVTGKAGGGCSSAESKNSTLTFTYEGNSTLYVELTFTLTLNDGKCSINGKEYSSGDTITAELTQADPNFPIYIQSKEGNYTTSINISSLVLSQDSRANLTLIPSENGSYTFNGTEIISEQIVSVNGLDSFTLLATPNDDYEFFGWYFNNELVSSSNPFVTTYSSSDATVYAKFVIQNSAYFKNNGVLFTNLNDAINSAQTSSDKIIVLNRSGVLAPAGDYNIPNGITLYIPNDSTVTIYTNNDVVQQTTGTKVTEYMRLTLKENTSINAEYGSTIYVAAICSGTQTGRVVGGYGHIVLESETSTINLQSGATLYCYGYITGQGLVNSYSGSTVYEFFQMTSRRGGTATKNMINNDYKVFVITQYYVQNIESRLKVYSGANIKVRTGITASFIDTVLAQADCTFIGDGGIFRLSSGYLERFYDATTDRIVYTVNGKTSISSISLDLSVSIFNFNLNSANYVLPITNNMDINVINNSEITIDQDLNLLPGVVLTIENGSILRFSQNTSLYVYDNDNWYNQKYGGNNIDISQLTYVASNNGKPVSRTSTASTPDAEIDLNGEIIVNDGAAIYTTLGTLDNGFYTGGANIHSSKGTGKITFVQGLGANTVTYQAKQSNTSISYVDIPVDTAYLKNGDGSYFIPSQYAGGIVNKTIYYDSILDRWTITETQAQKYNITFKDSKSLSTFTMEYTVGESFTFPTKEEVNFSYETYDIKYWQVGNDTYVPGQSIIMGNNGDMIATSIRGGRIQNKGEYKYIDYDTGEYLTGLHKLESYNSNDSNLNIYLFDENGIYLSSYNGFYFNSSDNKTYYIVFGKVLEKKGFNKLSISSSVEDFEYIYIQSDNSLLTSIDNYYIDTNLNNLLPSGYYSFDSNGHIKRDDLDTTNYDGKPYIKDYITYIDGIKVSYGLFTYQNYYYYSNINCEIVRNTTFYVSKTNNLGISEGLYYFDDQGRMYDQNFNLMKVKQDETK